ncbi:Putative tyrosine-protein kinase, active [Septoria linicola]|uniref:EKC/KEOPS complex subunit BUD32 n=1 Tax=Septoria linicola TaxID=215465 RepID=A0A9Q9AC78_9PEZI|nr:putative tyrosine-protein kinase, active [Septoria linicola]USW46864.1 Putative tyrosine-protein kinase, active [Septoria linicola]
MTTTTTVADATSKIQSRLDSLPAPFSTSPEPFELITQGAEALVYKTSFLTPCQPAALKIRPKKTWRHPTLDKRLTKQRITAEAGVLVKCRKEGVPVPAVLGLDWEKGWTAVEWIEGVTVKAAIRERAQEGGVGGGDDRVKGLLTRIGEAVGRLHACGVIHGDLTTSNMMLRRNASDQRESELNGEIVLIDFGLASQAQQEEERAVDLYVLERAFGSTHPKEEEMFGVVLEAYGGAYKGAKTTLRRLEVVRMRGRKKSMLG